MKTNHSLLIFMVLFLLVSCIGPAISDEEKCEFCLCDGICWNRTADDVRQSSNQQNIVLDDSSCLIFKEISKFNNENTPYYCSYLFDRYGHLTMIGYLYEKEDYDSVKDFFNAQKEQLSKCAGYVQATVEAESMTPPKNNVSAWYLPDDTLTLLCLSESITDISTEVLYVNPHYQDEFTKQCGIKINKSTNNSIDLVDVSEDIPTITADSSSVSSTYDNDSESSIY